LSYTTFEYANLRLSAARIGPGEPVAVSVDVTNTGGRPGREIVQLYVQDVLSSVSTPIMELKGFEKVGLGPGETRTVRLVLKPDDLALLNRHLERVVEPGEFRVLVGSSSADIRLRGSFAVAEP
jgi:beta-glucosidase